MKISQKNNNLDEKWCFKCNSYRNISRFSKNRRQCKDCRNLERKIVRQNNPDREKCNRYRSKYGISLKKYTEMLESQDFRCKICTKHQDNHRRPLSIDHCHKTNKIRGLLCDDCNLGLGKFKDDMKLLFNAAEYLFETK